MSYQNFTIRNRKDWDEYINRSYAHEGFHTWYYHSLNTEGEPLLFVYEEKEIFIALPVIKRKIENSAYFDMTCVYGYAGPISNVKLTDLSNITTTQFKAAFQKFMDDESSVCIFSRLHPFLNQHYLLENLGGIKDNGTTLYVDLAMSVEDQRNGYDKRLGRQIRSLRKMEYIIKEANSLQEIEDFAEMYYKNMDRLNASAVYYFDVQHFVNLLNEEYMKNKLVLIYDGPNLMCGAIILISDEIVRNHLSATAPDYLNISPSKLLTDEISLIGRRLGKKIFHLGGGVGGKEDSLFNFKKLFSTLQVKDRIWCYINNEAVYNDLVVKSGVDPNDEIKFFPLYRHPHRKIQTTVTETETTTIENLN
ncbi:GNAT family N-acetyltransferase [Mucilaginibacter endophyticus]|uniref:GNAT family N-acetyltransferase n=1 Tax=Mucilaginibacter endophyticus TaxID=2675003 RepID=UPI001ABF71AC|nr:GNAT family N-acetyltransferase [Mucilaginibacter endophyticus]